MWPLGRMWPSILYFKVILILIFYKRVINIDNDFTPDDCYVSE